LGNFLLLPVIFKSTGFSSVSATWSLSDVKIENNVKI
jgi:hypothetical protein